MIGTKEAAELLGVIPRRVRVLCAEGRIPGAQLVGKIWMLPNNPTVKAADRVRPSKIAMKPRKKKGGAK